MSVWDEFPLPPPPDGERPHPAPAPAPAPSGRQAGPQRRSGVPIWLLVSILAVVGVAGVAGALLLLGDDAPSDPSDLDRPSAGAVTSVSTPPTTPDTQVVITNAPETSATTTAPVVTTTTAPATTAPATTAPATTVPATTVPSTTVASPTIPSTTVPTPTTAPDDPGTSIVTDELGRTLTVTSRQAPCGSGPDCLVVAFTIDGFPTQPDEFVCEFASGSRFGYRFTTSNVDPACSTADAPDSIVVEVDGLRSEPITAGG